MRISILAVLVVGFCPGALRAEHADIVLRVMRLEANSQLVADEVTAYADQEPPAGGVKQRPLLKVKAQDPLVLRFILINTYPHGVNKNVTVRYYVVREEKAGQKTLPDLRGEKVIHGQFQMNFKPKCKVGANLAFAVAEPGIYLLRVDTLNTGSDHEHFSAVDLLVEKNE